MGFRLYVLTRTLVLPALLCAVVLVAAACESTPQTPTVDDFGPTRTPDATPSPGQTPSPTATPTMVPSPTPSALFPGFDFEIGTGAFWEFRWSYTDRSCNQRSGCSTSDDEGLFQVMLGQPREIQGITAYEVQVVGKHQVALADANRDFAPRWRYLAVSGNRILGSQGPAYTVIFDGQTGKWAGSGFFTERFNADELIEATPSTITQDDAFAGWPGVRTGPAINIGRASSQGLCETIAGERICPREETFDVKEREVYRGGVGPVGYFFDATFTFSGGGFFSSVQTTEAVGLVTSSLRGDTATSVDVLLAFQRVESEPNNSLQTAHPLSLPGVVSGDASQTDSWGELRFFNDAIGEMQFIQLHDIFMFTVAQQQAVTITLNAEGGASADLNLLLFTLSSVEGPDTIFIDGQMADLIDLSTVNDPTETITVTLVPGTYFTAIQAFNTSARTDYSLTIE